MHRAIANYASGTAGAPDDAALLERHEPLISRAARRMVLRTGLQSAYDDLWSAGALGLLEAARRFDNSKGIAFETFAEHRVRGAMLDELRRMDHLPRRLRARTDDVQKAKHKLATDLGREATVEEIAAELKLDLEETSDLTALLEPPLPLEHALASLTTGESTDEQMLRTEACRALTFAIEKLPERLKMVLSLHYVEDLTYREIARLLQVSEPRICQLHAEALKQLRAIMTE